MERILALHALSSRYESSANFLHSTESENCSSETAKGCSSTSLGCPVTTIVPPTGGDNNFAW